MQKGGIVGVNGGNKLTIVEKPVYNGNCYIVFVPKTTKEMETRLLLRRHK